MANVMRFHLITEREKQIIMAFLERGERLEGFRTLLYRARRLNLEEIDRQVEMVKVFLKKVNEIKTAES
jgi:hypothetical protein